MPSNPSLALRRTGNRAARVCAVLLWLLIGASRAAGADLAGDYTGWIYLDVGDDMPIRAHVEQADGGLRGTLDSPVLGVGGAPTEVAIAGDRLTLTTPDLGGWRVETTVERRDADTLRGRIVWSAGERTLEGEVWLHRVDAELPWVPLDALPDAAGVYPLEDGRSILISERPWGEMRYADTRTGRSGTMLAQTPTTYLIGDRAYDASSIAARATLQLDEGGRVVALEWTDTGAEPRTGARTAFHVEPVSFERGGATLHGEITRLPGGADQPGVVVIGGADWRTAAGLRRHAQVLASFGLTTLTFDKRGWGDSGGDPDCAFEEIAQDLLAGAALLRSRPDVRGAEVGIFGYSQAAWPMAIAASSADDLAFSIMLVPPAVTPAAQETTSRMHRLRESGVTDGADLALAAEYLAATWRFARDAEGGERLVELRDQIASRDWEGVLGDFDSLDEVGWRWWRRNGHFDPSAALRSLRCPTLAVFGGADTAVSIDQNLEPMRSAFKAGSAEDATCIVIDGADHGLSHVDPDDGMRRLHTARGWSSDLWPAVLGWLRERVDLAGE